MTMDPLEQLLALTRAHGNAEGNQAQIADLQDLCQAMWRLLTKEQKDAFLTSDEVASLRECAGGEEATQDGSGEDNAGCEWCGAANATGPDGLCDNCRKNVPLWM
jgi:hypothetical protein